MDLILRKWNKCQQESIKNPYQYIIKCLNKKEDKGRTNVDIKDWIRNYKKRQIQKKK